MKIFNQITMIFIIWAIGEYISDFINEIIVIPGSIIGMIILFLLLKTEKIKLEQISELGDFLLDNMAIFFIPSGVSLIQSLDLIGENIVVLIVTIVISTIGVMYVTGYIVQMMINKRERKNV